jgi:hypothetical protein
MDQSGRFGVTGTAGQRSHSLNLPAQGGRTMRKSLLLAASIAAVFVLASVDRSAEARGERGATMAKPKAGKASKAAPRRAAAPKKKAASRGFLPRKAGTKGPGQCGTFMYWKGGKCMDARLPKK